MRSDISAKFTKRLKAIQASDLSTDDKTRAILKAHRRVTYMMSLLNIGAKEETLKRQLRKI